MTPNQVGLSRAAAIDTKLQYSALGSGKPMQLKINGYLCMACNPEKGEFRREITSVHAKSHGYESKAEMETLGLIVPLRQRNRK